MRYVVFFLQELKKANALKSQLENYKRQVHELHAQLSEQTRKADKAEFDAQRHQEKVSQLQSENEVSELIVSIEPVKFSVKKEYTHPDSSVSYDAVSPWLLQVGVPLRVL